MVDLYKNWAYMGPFIAFYVVLVLLCNMDSMSSLTFWVWLQFPIYLMHEFEEHAFPGKFKIFVNKEIFRASENVPLSEKRVFWINIIAVWIVFPICAVLSQLINSCYGIYIVYFALLNGLSHIFVSLIKQKYNPGLFVSIFLSCPGALYTLWIAHKSGVWGFTLNITAFLVAFFSHPIIVALMMYWHKQQKNISKEIKKTL